MFRRGDSDRVLLGEGSSVRQRDSSPSKTVRRANSELSKPIQYSLLLILGVAIFGLFTLLFETSETANGDLLIKTRQIAHTSEPNKGFLLYLPHSGFSNQISELENALLIAHILNRTLVLPPFYLGFTENPFLPYEDQIKNLRLIEALFTEGSAIKRSQAPLNADYKCRKLFEVMEHRAIVSMDSLFDFKDLPEWANVKSIREFVSIMRKHGKKQLDPSKDLTEFKEQIMYTFRYIQNVSGANPSYFVDNAHNNLSIVSLKRPYNRKKQHYVEIMGKKDREWNAESVFKVYDEKMPLFETKNDIYISRVPLDKYAHIVNLGANYPLNKVVVLGSTFGFSRVLLTDDKTEEKRWELKERMIYKNQILQNVAVAITDQIEEQGPFIGIHIRGGDGKFSERTNTTIKSMAQVIKDKMCKGKASPVKCLQSPLRFYVATDISPKHLESMLKPIYDLSAEVFYLQMFEPYFVDLENLKNSKLSRQDTMSEVLDMIKGPRAPLSKDDTDFTCSGFENYEMSTDIWLPFLDQIIASRGVAFIGTKGSTFTGYIERLHKDLYGEKAFIAGKV
jgi:hypothetical protein